MTWPSPRDVLRRGARLHPIALVGSASQIARQLGVPLQITELARTFAEIEEALSVSR